MGVRSSPYWSSSRARRPPARSRASGAAGCRSWHSPASSLRRSRDRHARAHVVAADQHRRYAKVAGIAFVGALRPRRSRVDPRRSAPRRPSDGRSTWRRRPRDRRRCDLDVAHRDHRRERGRGDEERWSRVGAARRSSSARKKVVDCGGRALATRASRSQAGLDQAPPGRMRASPTLKRIQGESTYSTGAPRSRRDRSPTSRQIYGLRADAARHQVQRPDDGRTAGRDVSSSSHCETLDVEADVQDVAVLDDVGLPSSRCRPRRAASACEPHSSRSSQRITSQRMKPRAMSEWIDSAASSAVWPCRSVHERASVSPTVKNVDQPERVLEPEHDVVERRRAGPELGRLLGRRARRAPSRARSRCRPGRSRAG